MQRKKPLFVLRHAANFLVIQPAEKAGVVVRAGAELSDAEALQSDFSMVALDVTDAITNYEQRKQAESYSRQEQGCYSHD